jgi:AcrR family transcriptional regulator
MTTQESIIEAAGKIFERFGYTKTSMNDIARAARKGRRTVYTYFTSKEDVFRAVIETEVRELANRLIEMISQDMPADEKLRIYMHTRMNAVKDLTIYYEALRQDLMGNLGLIENLRREYDELEVTLIRQILDEGVSKALFDIGDTLLVANAIQIATKGFELPIYMGKATYDHNKFIDPLIQLFYQGIANRNNTKDAGNEQTG